MTEVTAQSQMGPLAAERRRDRVLGYIEKGKADGATLATGGGPRWLPAADPGRPLPRRVAW